MNRRTYEELNEEHEKFVLGLQYTIAQRERLKVLIRLIGKAARSGLEADIPDITAAIMDSKSERYQDIFALLLSGGKLKGSFVEFGACDGLAMNNTAMLEQRFGWTGILAEPDRFWQKGLQLNRTASIDKRCVSSETGRFIEFFQSDRPGNSSPLSTHPYLGKVVDSYNVETVSFMDLLKDHNAPHYIDFLSVDTEGHEKAVFENFDFEKYRFGFICVEEHDGVAEADSVEPILRNAGYTIILPREEGRPIPMQITEIDKFFVPIGHPALEW